MNSEESIDGENIYFQTKSPIIIVVFHNISFYNYNGNYVDNVHLNSFK